MRTRLKRSWRRALCWLVAVVIGVGPWPNRDDGPGSYTSEVWFRDTQVRLDRLPLAASPGPLRAGAAQVDLTGPPVCLAGHPAQMGRPSVGATTPCAARALTVAQGARVVTIVGADLLLVNEALTREVATRAGVDRGELFFTATHTHTGPGGWGLHPLERLVAGTFDPDEMNHLAHTLAEAVIRSRRHLIPVEVAFVAVNCPGVQTNRIEPTQPTNDRLSAWIVRSRTSAGTPARTLATLASFGAHATMAGGEPPRLDGDYPVSFAARLAERVDAGIVLFAAGTVGDSAPVRPRGLGPRAGAAAYGQHLAEALAPALATARFEAEVELINLPLSVDLPAPCLPLRTAWLRFSPLATWWVGPRRTHLHLVRFGPAYLVGFPGDVAGHLAGRLHASLPIVATSFNGDYKGYLVSRDTFLRCSCYETRWMNFFGGNLGEALADLSQRGLDRLATPRH